MNERTKYAPCVRVRPPLWEMKCFTEGNGRAGSGMTRDPQTDALDALPAVRRPRSPVESGSISLARPSIARPANPSALRSLVTETSKSY